jgi:alkanesulfonate monooxygenase SsuD/methylene tetrahydromethanopterin reductase-like flavin-dependent oxidoreductase (luciferase family)
MRLGTLILPDVSWQRNVDRWRAADQLGFDSAWTYDHIWWRGLRDSPWFAAVPVLTAAAAMTERIRLGLMVASPNFRHPVLTAKEAIAIDDISGGRFTLGVGSGAPSAGDAEVLGGEPLPPAQRAARFAEFVRLTGELLDKPVVSRTGRYFSVSQARMIPGSVQRPRLPLAVAASGPRGLRLAAAAGDAWITAGPADWTGGYTPEECLAAVTGQVAGLRNACGEAGRDFDAMERIMIATPMCGNPLESAKACLRIAEQYAAAGMTHMVIHWPRESGIYAADEHVIHDIAVEALPQIAAL